MLADTVEMFMGQDDQDVTLGELSRLLKGFINATEKRFDILEKSTVTSEIYALKNAQLESQLAQLAKQVELVQVGHSKDVERLEKMAVEQARQFQTQIEKLERWKETKDELAESHRMRSRDEAVAEDRQRNFRLALLSTGAVLISGGLGSLLALLVR